MDFLIKSTLSMALLLAVYHVFLAREKMHRFNRFYLLFALMFSLAVPFISFTIYTEAVAQAPLPARPIEIQNFTIAPTPQQPVDYTMPLLLAIYALVTVALALRFAKNIRHFLRQVNHNPSRPHQNATLVLMEGNVIPHTFLNYIFVSKEDYEQNTIEQELYTHELAHVRQKHSVDILFIEVLKTVLWFNPLLYFYKKAIQLNHEFLADETVVNQSNNIVIYQQLLLQKAVPQMAFQLASSLNYSVTKKRFMMMTKATPKSKALLLKLAALPVIAGLIYALCTQTVAQTSPIINTTVFVEELPASQQSSHAATNKVKRDSYYAGVRIVVKNDKRKTLIDKPYEQLTEAEKDKYLMDVPGPTQKKQLTAKQYADLKDSTTYGVWIDGKRVDNAVLNKFSITDFAFYYGSAVYKNAQTKANPQPYQFNLYTHDYFDANLENSYKKFGSDTYTVVTGSYSAPKKATDSKTKAEAAPPKIAEGFTNTTDTVKDKADAEARRARVFAERAKIMKQRETLLAKRDSLKGSRREVLDGAHVEKDSAKAQRERARAAKSAKKS